MSEPSLTSLARKPSRRKRFATRVVLFGTVYIPAAIFFLWIYSWVAGNLCQANSLDCQSYEQGRIKAAIITAVVCLLIVGALALLLYDLSQIWKARAQRRRAEREYAEDTEWSPTLVYPGANSGLGEVRDYHQNLT